MFRLALGLENSVTLNTLQLHLKQLNFPDDALESVALHLESLDITYFDTVVSLSFTSESNIVIVLGTASGQVCIQINLLNSLWRVSVGMLEATPYKAVTVATVDANEYMGIYDEQYLSQVILTGVDVMDAGTQSQLFLATDPPFYKEGGLGVEPEETTAKEETAS